jgi:hypothetical protein
MSDVKGENSRLVLNSGKLEHSREVAMIELMRGCHGEDQLAGQEYFLPGSIF